jgi:FkbM family methyltransferase
VDFSRFSRVSFLGKALRAPLSLIPKTAVFPVLQGPLAGRRWIVGSATHGAWLGTYEYEKQRIFARTIQAGMVVFDLGANVGFYSLLAAIKTGARGRVYAFEPLSRNLGLLRRHLEYNDIRNVEIIAAAVSDSSGLAAFEDQGHPSMGRLDPVGGLQIRTVTLDEMVFQKGLLPPDLIKLDIEGGERRALEGARRVLEQYHPLLFLATHGWQVHDECCAFLIDLGYALAGIDGGAPTQTDELIARFES